MLLDIIIPILNEEKFLLESQAYYDDLKNKANIIFVDGGSTDRSIELAQRYGTVVQSQTGRGFQKNRGFQESTAEHIVFLHVDAMISDQALQKIPHALSNGVVGGCLNMNIDSGGSIFRFYERVVNFRAQRFGIFDGDLGLFVKRQAFEEAGQFDRLAILEDLKFGKKLKRVGKTTALSESIKVSARKWHEQGFIKTFCCYTLAYVQLWTGIKFFK